MRNNGVDRLVSVIPQQQYAWEGLVVWVIGDNLTIRNHLGNRIWIYPALEHTLEGMAGEVQSFTVHAISRFIDQRILYMRLGHLSFIEQQAWQNEIK